MIRRPIGRLLRLEDRLTPAIATWDGGGTNNNWMTAANWVGDVAPNPGDDLVFPDGAAQLTNVNDFGAPTGFASLAVNGGGYQISGNPLTVNAGVSANIPGLTSSTIALSIGGSGGLSKVAFGPGTLVLSGANSYTGVTAVTEGTLEIRSSTALGATGPGNGTTVAEGSFPGTITVPVTGLDIQEAISFGSLNIEPAALVAADGINVTLSGPITLAGPARITAGTGSSITFTNSFSGMSTPSFTPFAIFEGNIVVAATSVSTLNGSFDVRGTTQFNGTASASSLSAFGGTVSGTGTLGGPVVASSGGTVAPGINGPGTLTTGNLTVGPMIVNMAGTVPGGTLAIDLTDAGVDRVNAHGLVSLGGNLALSINLSFNPGLGTRYRIIDNDGSDAVQNTFAGLPEGAIVHAVGNQALRITYRGGDGNDVELFVGEQARSFAVGAGPGGVPQVNVYNQDGSLLRSFLAYEASFRGGVHVATSDVTGDGVADTITAPGVGGGPVIRIWDGVTGAMIRQFNAYDPNFRGGAFVASSDIDADGRKDIITGAGAGGGPHVKVFSGLNGAVLSSFLAYSPLFLGGVSVAGTDGANVPIAHVHYNGTIITGAGPGGGPHVRTFDGITGVGYGSFFAYALSFTGGVNVAVGEFGPIDTGGPNIVTAPASAGQPNVRVYNSQGQQLASYFAYAPAFNGGVSVAVQPIGVGGTDAILTGAGPGGGPHVEKWEFPGPVATRSFFAFDPAFTGGVFVG